MLDLYDKIQDACAVIRKAWPHHPHAGIILGTGLGPLVQRIDVQATLDYEERGKGRCFQVAASRGSTGTRPAEAQKSRKV